MKEVDYIIVGQGIAGSCMALKLLKEDKSFLVIDNYFHKASSVAAGIFNPVVLKRFSTVWDAKSQLKKLHEVFDDFENLLEDKYKYIFPVYRVFNNEQERITWKKKATTNPSLMNFLSKYTKRLNNYPSIKAPNGIGEVQHTGRIDLKKLLDDFKNYLEKKNLYINENFDFTSLTFNEKKAIYKKIKADRIIFCDGYNILNNPFFKNLPIIGVKGEVLSVRINEALPKAVIKGKEFLMPLQNNFYFVGATYDRDNLNYENTIEAKDYLVNGIKNFFNGNFEVISQQASIRPTVIDRRPIIGEHPKIKQLVCFNGMGTRGTMLAPTMTDNLYKFLECNESIDKEVDIARFYSLF